MPVVSVAGISHPFIHGFYIAAVGSGASTFQIAEVTGRPARAIHDAVRDISSTLALKLNENPPQRTLIEVQEMWDNWNAEHNDIVLSDACTLVEFRKLITSHLELDH